MYYVRFPHSLRKEIVMDKLPSYKATLKELNIAHLQKYILILQLSVRKFLFSFATARKDDEQV